MTRRMSTSFVSGIVSLFCSKPEELLLGRNFNEVAELLATLDHQSLLTWTLHQYALFEEYNNKHLVADLENKNEILRLKNRVKRLEKATENYQDSEQMKMLIARIRQSIDVIIGAWEEKNFAGVDTDPKYILNKFEDEFNDSYSKSFPEELSTSLTPFVQRDHHQYSVWLVEKKRYIKEKRTWVKSMKNFNLCKTSESEESNFNKGMVKSSVRQTEIKMADRDTTLQKDEEENKVLTDAKKFKDQYMQSLTTVVNKAKSNMGFLQQEPANKAINDRKVDPLIGQTNGVGAKDPASNGPILSKKESTADDIRLALIQKQLEEKKKCCKEVMKKKKKFAFRGRSLKVTPSPVIKGGKIIDESIPEVHEETNE